MGNSGLRVKNTVIIISVLIVGLLCSARGSFGWEAQVVGVKDGDTIVVWDGKQQSTIRLDGIDAPEHNQAFGEKAKQFTSSMVFGKKVRLDGSKKDAYGRTIAEVYVNGQSLNTELVMNGLAWHYKKYSNNRNLAEAEDAAKMTGRGLWADKQPVPPWEFRHGKKEKTEAPDDLSDRNKKERDRALNAVGTSDGNPGGSSSGNSTGATYTGPRGGQYHYSASGKKVYNRK